MHLEKDYAFFQNLVLLHSVQRPPFSEKIFSYKVMMDIVEYVTKTYFRHYLMYKFTFTKKSRMEFTIENFMPVPEAVEEPVAEAASETETSPADAVVAADEKDHAEEAQKTEEKVKAVEEALETALTAMARDTEPIVAVAQEKAAVMAKVSPKHEAALNDLKTFISGVLATKLDEIKTAVAQKIQAQEGDQKKTGGAKQKK
ncbi:hypothetical protein HDU91_003106 [Kappamyces sp. JEL0680]|nr:hypothetical protein HDU91_003106 [Kappamyces sp. JEL0680]